MAEPSPSLGFPADWVAERRIVSRWVAEERELTRKRQELSSERIDEVLSSNGKEPFRISAEAARATSYEDESFNLER